MVVMFKKINNKNLPPGLTVEAFSSFFTELFTYQTSEEKQSFKANIASLLVNPNYHVLAITVPVFDVQDPSQLLTHFIVGAVRMTTFKPALYTALSAYIFSRP
jgi:hypothetical protein